MCGKFSEVISLQEGNVSVKKYNQTPGGLSREMQVLDFDA